MKAIARPEAMRMVLEYNPETGSLRWLRRTQDMFDDDSAMNAITRCAVWNKRFAGREAFTSNKGGGRMVSPVFGRIYLAHRVAWAMHYGAWPKGQIDHINGNPSDNRISNLRDVSMQVNSQNMPLRVDNSTGVPGVTRHQGKWQARIARRYIGMFSEFSDAVAARRKAEAELNYHPNHGRIPE